MGQRQTSVENGRKHRLRIVDRDQSNVVVQKVSTETENDTDTESSTEDTSLEETQEGNDIYEGKEKLCKERNKKKTGGDTTTTEHVFAFNLEATRPQVSAASSSGIDEVARQREIRLMEDSETRKRQVSSATQDMQTNRFFRHTRVHIRAQETILPLDTKLIHILNRRNEVQPRTCKQIDFFDTRVHIRVQETTLPLDTNLINILNRRNEVDWK